MTDDVDDVALVRSVAAIVGRIIPSDDGWPGGTEAGTERYVLARAALGESPDRSALQRLTDALDTAARAHVGVAFVDAGPSHQDALLQDLDDIGDRTFIDLVERAMEGFYGDPRHGGNDGAVSWRMIGFPGPAGPRGYRPPLGAYDASEPPLPGLELQADDA